MYHGKRWRSGFGQFLYVYCKGWGIPFAKVARALDIPCQTFHQIISGETSTAKQEYVDRLVALWPWTKEFLYGKNIRKDPCAPIDHPMEV